MCILPSNNGSYAWTYAQTNTGKAATRLAISTKSIKCARRASLYTNNEFERFVTAASNLPPRLTNTWIVVTLLFKMPWHHSDQQLLTWCETTGHTYPVMSWSRRRAGHIKRNWHTTAFCAKNRLSTEPVRKQRAVVELSRAEGCIKEEETVRPETLARLGPHTLKVVPGFLPVSRSGLNSTAGARFRVVTSLPQCSRDRGERALFSYPLCPIHVWLKGYFPQNHTHTARIEYIRIIKSLLFYWFNVLLMYHNWKAIS